MTRITGFTPRLCPAFVTGAGTTSRAPRDVARPTVAAVLNGGESAGIGATVGVAIVTEITPFAIGASEASVTRTDAVSRDADDGASAAVAGDGDIGAFLNTRATQETPGESKTAVGACGAFISSVAFAITAPWVGSRDGSGMTATGCIDVANGNACGVSAVTFSALVAQRTSIAGVTTACTIRRCAGHCGGVIVAAHGGASAVIELTRRVTGVAVRTLITAHTSKPCTAGAVATANSASDNTVAMTTDAIIVTQLQAIGGNVDETAGTHVAVTTP